MHFLYLISFIRIYLVSGSDVQALYFLGWLEPLIFLDFGLQYIFIHPWAKSSATKMIQDESKKSDLSR